MSHVINRIGDRMEAPNAVALCSAIAMTASHSSNVRFTNSNCLTKQFKTAWRLATGSAFVKPGATRWYSWVDTYRNILVNYDYLYNLLTSREFLGTAAASAWNDHRINPERQQRTLIELETLVAYGAILYKACFILESDGQAVFHADRIWNQVRECLRPDAPLPTGLKAFLKQVHSADGSLFTYEQGRKVSEGVIRPARIYTAVQEGEHSPTLYTFEAASLWNPTIAKTKDLTPENLKKFVEGLPWMSDDTRRLLETEVFAYKAACQQVTGTVDNILHFFRDNEKSFPTWAMISKRLTLIQPSSASIERVWSLHSRFFVDAGIQDALIDYIRYVLMNKYNTRSDEKDDKTGVPAAPGPISELEQ